MKFGRILKFIMFCGLVLGTSAAWSDDFTIGGEGRSAAPKLMDERLAQNAAVRYAKELFAAPNDPVAGNPNGKITLVEFFDFRCPHCDRMEPIVNALIASNPDLRVIYKNFPILGSKSLFASQAALAAVSQGKYLAFHSALMEHGNQLNESEVFSLAKSVGIDVPRLKADINNEKIDYHIDANVKLGRSLGIIGTPAFFIAKTNLPTNAAPAAVGFVGGEVEQKYLQYLINEARL